MHPGAFRLVRELVLCDQQVGRRRHRGRGRSPQFHLPLVGPGKAIEAIGPGQISAGRSDHSGGGSPFVALIPAPRFLAIEPTAGITEPDMRHETFCGGDRRLPVVQIGEKTNPAPTHKLANRCLFIWNAALFILAVLCVLGPLTLSVTAGSARDVMPLAVPPAARSKAAVMPLAVPPAARSKAAVMPLAVPPAVRSKLPWAGVSHF
jgi:hypothetical protein